MDMRPGDGGHQPPEAAGAAPPLLALCGLSARYGQVAALKAVDLHLNAGELVTVLGPNGAGKSTLLAAVMGLLPSEGTVSFQGRQVQGLSTQARAKAGMIMVPEGRGIFAPMTVRENLELGGYAGRDPQTLDDRRAQVFALFPRLKQRLDQLAGSLSGGEQQMLAVGRALMASPTLLMLDEPSLGLAPRVAAEIMQALGALNRAGLGILLVEQKAPLALKLASRAYILSVGRVVAEPRPEELRSVRDLSRYYLADHAA